MADTSETGSDAQITFKVKSSNDKTHTITMAESATVLDLKTKLAGSDFEDTPAERQRLIYSGRIMKDADALSVYKIKHNNTIHMVKSARSNPTPAASSAASSTPTPAAVPANMASGSHANDLLAGLTGARFAGHANLPSADLFGADGGMGAPPSEEQMAEMLSNPMIAQSMNEALNNPNFIDFMLRSNPTLASMPNAREMLQSPQFRNMMTNPEAIRMAARMRRVMQGGAAPAFPAPGATDNTPAGAAASGDAAPGASANNNNNDPFMALFGGSGAFNPFAAGQNPFAAFGNLAPPAAPAGGAAAPTTTSNPPGAASSENTQGSTTGTQGQGQGQNQTGATNTQAPPPANPFAALFGAGLPGAPQPGANANAGAANPFGLPPISPEALQQIAQLWGTGGSPFAGLGGGLGAGAAAAAPPDNRPPEERYAEQLRQLNDMGFFDFERNVTALRRSGGSVQGAVEYLLSNP